MNIIPAEHAIKTSVPFNNGPDIHILSAPEGSRLDITDYVRDIRDFHGPRDVDQVVLFGQTLAHLAHAFEIPKDLDTTTDIQVLARQDSRAAEISDNLINLAKQVIADASLYDDVGFCKEYYNLAAQGYSLFNTPTPDMIPVSLIRAGLVTSRLAYGLGMNDIVPHEVKVETKRAHPKQGAPEDLMVTVRWNNEADPKSLDGNNLLIADFVNPASWASNGALFMVLKHCYGVTPQSTELRSFMGTIQGVELARNVCRMLKINPTFRFVDIASEMDEHYYLKGEKVVADAGHVLRHFQPS